MFDNSCRAFIFDMDGTLIDNMGFHARAWQQMLAENGIAMDTREFLVKTAGRTNREIIPGIFGAVSDERFAALDARKEALYREMFAPHRQTLPGVREFLTESERLGVRLAVATSAPPENVAFILDGLDLRRFFRAVVTADDITHGKPHPEIFLQSAARLGVAPGCCLVFEDALNGVEAAHRAGMPVIGLTTANPKEKLLGLPAVLEAHGDFRALRPAALLGKCAGATPPAQATNGCY